MNRLTCTGCGVCALLCPQKCISMETDDEGFAYPVTDAERCIGCGKCSRVCHLNDKSRFSEGRVYAAISNHTEENAASSSGGMFSLLAGKVLASGGAVIGCALEELSPRHIIIESGDELYRLRGSKYVESEISGILPEIKKILTGSRKVLFSGTGCQIAAAKAFLGENSNIVYVEILCHGVPSRRLFDELTGYYEEKYTDTLANISFRDKQRFGWTDSYILTCTFSSGRAVSVPCCDDAFFCNYISGSLMRESCYSCAYAGSERVGDITLGDYWGITERHAEIPESRGVSFVSVNSEAGKRLFDSCRDEAQVFRSEMILARESLHALVRPVARPQERDNIYADAYRLGYARWNREFLHSKLHFKEKTKHIVKRMLPAQLRKRIVSAYHSLDE